MRYYDHALNVVRLVRKSKRFRTCNDCARPLREGYPYVRVAGYLQEFGAFFVWVSCEECAYDNNFIKEN